MAAIADPNANQSAYITSRRLTREAMKQQGDGAIIVYEFEGTHVTEHTVDTAGRPTIRRISLGEGVWSRVNDSRAA